MSDIDTGALESALGNAFSPEPAAPAAPAAPKAPAKAAAPAAPAAPVEEPEVPQTLADLEADPAELLPEEESVQEAPPEPSYELVIDGKPELIQGSDRVKELLAKGLKAGRGFEEIARVREALQAHGQQAQLNTQFHQAVSQDLAQMQALDLQLQQYERLDWSAAYDSDPLNALKLKAQRDQLKEQRAAVVENLNAKQQQFAAQFQQNSQRLLAAESEALLAKVPAWRNPEKAQQERGEIATALTSQYGFTPAEVGSLMDHRMLLVARDAAAYRKLLANKDAKVKQAREAPATAKPGASQTPNGRASTSRLLGQVKALGTKGNHRAQEDLMTQVLGRAFK